MSFTWKQTESNFLILYFLGNTQHTLERSQETWKDELCTEYGTCWGDVMHNADARSI